MTIQQLYTWQVIPTLPDESMRIRSVSVPDVGLVENTKFPFPALAAASVEICALLYGLPPASKYQKSIFALAEAD